MKQDGLLGLILSGSILLSGCQQNEQAVDISQLPAGQRIFLNECLMCHQGPGNPPGPDHRITLSEKLGTQAGFAGFLRHPNNGLMPPFSPDRLADEEIAQLYQYLHRLQPEKPEK